MFSWELLRIVVSERKSRDAFAYRILILFLRVAEAVRRERAIESTDNHNVIIAAVDEPLDETPLRFVSSWKVLHSARYTVELKKSRHHFHSLHLKVPIR